MTEQPLAAPSLTAAKSLDRASYELRRGDLAEFFAVPFACYAQPMTYVSPLRSDLERFFSREHNPLFRDHGDFQLFTVRRGKKLLGRICAHIHYASNLRHGLKRSYFGFFDCADDQGAAATLLAAAEDWGRSRGCDEIAGNFNLTAMQQIGVTTGGFGNQPYTDQLYSPPQIARLLQACGYTPFFPMRTFDIDVAKVDLGSAFSAKSQAVIERPDLEWRQLTRRNFTSLLQDACAVLNDGFDQNPMFVPLSAEEFSYQAKEMVWILDPRISSMVYQNGRPLGVVVCIPDLNPLLAAARSRLNLHTAAHYLRYRLRRDRAIIIFYSVCREAHNQGINGAMLYQVFSALQRCGYAKVGITWIAESNKASLRQAERLGASTHHTQHLFKKSLLPPLEKNPAPSLPAHPGVSYA